MCITQNPLCMPSLVDWTPIPNKTPGKSSKMCTETNMCSMPAFCTTPTEALEIEASILPIKHQVNLHKKQCAMYFNKLSNTSPIIQRLPQAWRNGEKPTAPPPLQPKLNNNSATDCTRTTYLLELAKHTCHSHERIDPYLTAPWR